MAANVILFYPKESEQRRRSISGSSSDSGSSSSSDSDSISISESSSEEEIQRKSFTLKQLVRKLHISSPVYSVMCLIGKK